ncbi:MAG: hypothetical protein QM495_06315 [Lutibacter sp.]|uniref:hypothetical protein n=1 Tax=Lutibacter sp. TaxID=1925666 RepID=UPI00385C940A
MKNSNHFFKFFIEMTADIPEVHLSHFNDLLDILLSLFSDRIKNNNVQFEDERLYYINLLSQKIMAHCFTIKSLIKGVTLSSSINNFSILMLDPFSIYSIERTLIENYLVQNYLSNSLEAEDTLDCRFAIWMRYGINKRNVTPKTDNEKRVVELDQKAIINFDKKIKLSKCYKNLSKQKKESFLKTINKEWKIMFHGEKFYPISWDKLLTGAGIRDGVNNNMYNYLSWHSHTQSLSILQFKEMWDTNSEEESIIMSIKKINRFIAFLIADISLSDENFKNVFLRLDNSNRNLVNHYNLVYRNETYAIKYLNS